MKDQQLWIEVDIAGSIVGQKACLVSLIRAVGDGKRLEELLREGERSIESVVNRALAAAPDEKPVMLLGDTRCGQPEERIYPATDLQGRSFIQSLVDAIPSPVFYRDKSGIFVFCNKAFEEFLKRTKEQIIGKTLYEVFSRKVAAQQHRVDMDLARHPGVHVYESVIPVDGQIRHTIVNQTTYFAADDEMAGVVGAIVDLTDQKDLETQLDAQNRLAAQLARTKSVKHALAFALKSALQVPGLDSGCAFLVHPASDRIELVSSRSVGKSSRKHFSLYGESGQLARLIMRGKPIYRPYTLAKPLLGELSCDPLARATALLPVHLDEGVGALLVLSSRRLEGITDAAARTLESLTGQLGIALTGIKSQEALKKSLDKYWGLMDDAAGAILLADLDGTILEANRTAEDLLGYGKADLLGMRLSELAPDLSSRRDLGIMVRGEGPTNDQTRIIGNGGRVVPVNLTMRKDRFGDRLLLQVILEDLTEQIRARQAQEALEESETRYKGLMHASSDAIILVDWNGKVIEANSKAEKLFGYTGEEFMGLDYVQLHPGDAWQRMLRAIDNESDVAYQPLEDITVLTKEDNPIPVDISWTVLSHLGRPIMQVLFHDMAERKRAETALRESESRYRTVFENTGTAMLMLDQDGTILLVNGQFEKLSGIPRGIVEGKKKWEEIVAEERPSSAPGLLRAARQQGSEQDTANHAWRGRIINKQGVERHVLITVAEMPGTDRKIASLIDISQLVHTEQVLKQSEERYRALVEQSSEGIFIVHPKTKMIIEANEALVNMLGSSVEDLKALSLYDIFREERSIIDKYLKRLLEKGTYFLGEKSFRGENGDIDVDVATALVSYANSSYVMVSVRNITEKKRMEQALRQAQKMEAVGTLAGGVAHDFNNILQVMAGHAYQLGTKLDKDHPLTAHVRSILLGAEKGSKLVGSMLAFSRKQDIDLKPVDINHVITGFKRFIRRIIGEDIEFKTEGPDESMVVMADQVQVEQILVNLAANAREAMPNGGSFTIRTDIVEMDEEFIKLHGYGELGAYARLSVSDTGLGMTEETMRRIFEPFYTTKPAGKGSGLGMSVVYGIVKQHNGYVMVQSEPNSGTTVEVYLPLMAVTRAPKPRLTVKESQDGLAGCTVLVAEDDSAVRELMKEVIEDAGCRVIEAANGEEAVERFKASINEIDLVLLDVVMPKKDGKEAFDEMKALREDLTAIFMSGYNEEIIQKKALPRNVTLLSKPVLPGDVLTRIAVALKK